MDAIKAELMNLGVNGLERLAALADIETLTLSDNNVVVYITSAMEKLRMHKRLSDRERQVTIMMMDFGFKHLLIGVSQHLKDSRQFKKDLKNSDCESQ